MIIKSKPTVNKRFIRESIRMEREKNLEIEQSKKLYRMRREVGAKRGEGRVGAKSRYAVMNAVRTMGKEVLTEAGDGYWEDLQRRYHWHAEDGDWRDGNSPNGHRNRLGVVRERYRKGQWEHWDAKLGTWVPGEVTKRKGIF